MILRNQITREPGDSVTGGLSPQVLTRQCRVRTADFHSTNSEDENLRNPTISTDASKIAFKVARDAQWNLPVRDRTRKVICPIELGEIFQPLLLIWQYIDLAVIRTIRTGNRFNIFLQINNTCCGL